MPKKKLGNGWYEAVDPTSGRTYFIHKDKRITQWNRPSDEDLGLVAVKEAAVASPTAEQAPAAATRGKWEKRFDQKSNKHYYVNKATRQSQWTVPDGFVEDESDAAAKKKKKKSRTIRHGDWQVRKDKKGRVYYANTKTMKTQWKKPPELEGLDLTFPESDAEEGMASGTVSQSDTAVEPQLPQPVAGAGKMAEADGSDSEDDAADETDQVMPLASSTVARKKSIPKPIRTTDSYFNMSEIVDDDDSAGGAGGGGGGATGGSGAPAAGSESTNFEDLSAYILGKTGAVTVNAIDGKRTNRGWGDNVVIDLRDIVDVHIDDATLQHDMAEFASTLFHALFIALILPAAPLLFQPTLPVMVSPSLWFSAGAVLWATSKDTKFHTKYRGPRVLDFNGKPLTLPLLAKLKTPALSKSAVQMSKNITGFVGTRKTSKAGFSHAEKIFHFVLEDVCEETSHDNIPLLWDEIYCQVIRVSALGADVPSDVTLKAWQLFAVLASVFPCSKSLFPYAMSWCEKIKTSSPGKQIADLAW